MRILAINDVSRAGGAGALFRRTNALLSKKGHEVVEFTGDTDSERAGLTGGGKAGAAGLRRVLPKSVRSWGGGVINELTAIKRAVHHLCYPALTRRLATAVRGRTFDVAHVHNLHNRLSPNVFRFLRSQNIPIVFQVNDYFFFCNNSAAFNTTLDSPCKRCIHGNAGWAALYGCSSYGDIHGRVVSLIEAAHRFVLNARQPWKAADQFLVTSRVAGELVVEYGLAREKLFPILNPVVMSEFDGPAEIGDEIVFYGGFLVHKGVETFMAALETVAPGTRLGVYLMGMTESYGRRLKDVAQRRGLNVNMDPALRWDGGLRDIVARSRAVLVPSRWWVTSENVVYEAMLFGKPVVVGTRGGNAELVDDGETGFHFDPEDAAALAALINRLASDRALAVRLGGEARRRALERFSEERFTSSLEDAYARAIRARGANTASR